MAIKKKQSADRAAKKRTARKRTPAQKARPRSPSSATRRRATGRQGTRKKRASKSAAVRRKERRVEHAEQHLIEAEKDLPVEGLPKRVHPATKKRGADPQVPSRIKRKRLSDPKEQKLEQGLEESMAGSDPVSITQPAMPISEKPDNKAKPDDDS